MTSSTRARCSISCRRAGPNQSSAAATLLLMWMCRPSMRFSSTVRCEKSSMFWNERATPSRAIRCGASFVSSWVAPAEPVAPPVCSTMLPCCGR